MCRLICIFVFRIRHKQVFSWHGSVTPNSRFCAAIILFKFYFVFFFWKKKKKFFVAIYNHSVIKYCLFRTQREKNLSIIPAWKVYVCYLRKNWRSHHRTTKPTKWPMYIVKTEISLGICPAWSESSLCTQWIAKDPSFFLRTASLLWRTCYFAGFVMCRLK